MTLWVKHDPYTFLRLVLCKPGTLLESKCQPDFEVVDLDVEVEHHQLFSGNRRPGGRYVVLLPLEFDLGVSPGRPDFCPAVLGRVSGPGTLGRDYFPPEETLVEPGKANGIGSVEHRTDKRQPWP